MLDVTQELCQLNSIVQRTARVTGNKIRHQILRQTNFFIFLRKGTHEFQIHILAGLAHLRQHLRRNMLRCNLEQTADVVSAQLVKELLLLIGKQIIVANTAANKHLLDAGQSTQLA